MTKAERKSVISDMIKAVKAQKKELKSNLQCESMTKEQIALVKSGIDIGFTVAIETLKDERDAVSGIVVCK